MARKSKQLTTAFDTMKTVETRTEPGHIDVTPHSNTETESNDVTQDVIQEVTPNVILEESPAQTDVTMDSIISKFAEKVEIKRQKQRVEDTHKRSTFLFRRDLAERLDKLSRGEDRGFKTMFMNDAIEALLDAYERETESE